MADRPGPGAGGGAGRLSRRGLIKAGGGIAFAGLSVAALKLPAFSVAGAQQDPAECRAEDLSASQAELVISNWPGYIDPRKKALFERLCVEEDATPSQVVRRLIRRYIEERTGQPWTPPEQSPKSTMRGGARRSGRA